MTPDSERSCPFSSFIQVINRCLTVHYERPRNDQPHPDVKGKSPWGLGRNSFSLFTADTRLKLFNYPCPFPQYGTTLFPGLLRKKLWERA